MSGPIDTALRDIFLEFDPILLKAGFKDELVDHGSYTRSLRDVVLEKIIYEHVLPDLSLTASTTDWVQLKSSYIIHQADDAVVISIPSNVLGNRSIIAPIQVASIDRIPSVGRVGALSFDAERVIDNGPNVIGTVSTELRKMAGENVILMQNFDHLSMDRYKMEVQLGHDRDFSGIPPSFYKLFSRLCILKVQVYLNSRYGSILDIAESNSGVSISRLRTMLERWDDSNTTYNEELDKWTKYSEIYKDQDDAEWMQMTTGFL